jgi:hypothetical protein
MHIVVLVQKLSRAIKASPADALKRGGMVKTTNLAR